MNDNYNEPVKECVRNNYWARRNLMALEHGRDVVWLMTGRRNG